MKKLSFAVKTNMNRPPRVHVQSADKKNTYGSFLANECEQFDGWDKLSLEETIELKQYMSNLQAIEHYFSTKALGKQKDFRVRLPVEFIQVIHEISSICFDAQKDINIYDTIISATIQYLKVVTAQLPSEYKQNALEVLKKIGLADNTKIDISLKIRAIFSELLSVHNKSEKLHQKAIELFNKDKSISPRTIEEIASGNAPTARWMTACAVDILIVEKPEIIQRLLLEDDLVFLWATPLIKIKYSIDKLIDKMTLLSNKSSITDKIIQMSQRINNAD